MQSIPVNSKKNSTIFVVGEPQEANSLRFQLAKQGFRKVYTFRELIDSSEALALLPADLIVADGRLPELNTAYLNQLSKKHPLVTGVTIVAVVCDRDTEINSTISSNWEVDISIEAVDRQQLAESIDQLLEIRQERLNHFSTATQPKKVSVREVVKKERSLRAAFQRSC